MNFALYVETILMHGHMVHVNRFGYNMDSVIKHMANIFTELTEMSIEIV